MRNNFAVTVLTVEKLVLRQLVLGGFFEFLDGLAEAFGERGQLGRAKEEDQHAEDEEQFGDADSEDCEECGERRCGGSGESFHVSFWGPRVRLVFVRELA